MFFSVIIPMYNVKSYIAECLQSILCQSMKDFEVVIVDDGSTDGSAEIVRAFMEKDSRIRLISQKNTGQSGARNHGLREGRGDYIIFLDSDDFLLRDDFLADLSAEIKSTDADVVMYKYVKYFGGDNPLSEKCHYSFLLAQGVSLPDKLIPILAENDAYYGSAWTKTVRRSILIDNGIFFDEGLCCEDFDWSYRVIEKSKKITCIDKEYIAYRQRQGSVTKSGSLKNTADFLKMVEKYKERYESYDLDISEEMRLGLLATVAKLYSNLLINYGRLKPKDKKLLKSEIKALAPVLEYGTSQRPRTIKKFVRIFGFNIALFALGMLDKIKK